MQLGHANLDPRLSPPRPQLLLNPLHPPTIPVPSLPHHRRRRRSERVYHRAEVPLRVPRHPPRVPRRRRTRRKRVRRSALKERAGSRRGGSHAEGEGGGGEEGRGGPFEPDFALLSVRHAPDLDVKLRVGGKVERVLCKASVVRWKKGGESPP